jgi:hypothetical protein
VREGIDRAQFLRRAGALGLLTATGSLFVTGGAAAARPAAAGRAPGAVRRGLPYRGICYDTGTRFFGLDGPTSRPVWNGPLMRGEIRAIRDRLHCNSVSLFGTDVRRLVETSTEALERGLHVWLQPRLFEHSREEVLDHLARTAREAERLRRRHSRLHLNVGCEYILFTRGIVPGESFAERVAYLSDPASDFQAVFQRLRAFIARAAAVARSHFNGKITYAAASIEPVDWSLFDFVGLDYYDFHRDPADHARGLAAFRKWGKPIVICEFGSCTYEGAPERGGSGYDIIDWNKDIPEIIGDPVRSEKAQADHLITMLGVFEAQGVHTASMYEFINPESPHSPNPRYDLDMACFAVVKTIREDFTDSSSPYRWEPKRAFHAIARHYRAAAATA